MNAVRVELTVLHDTTTPANAPDFSAFEGQFRYLNTLRDQANQPIFLCPDEILETTFRCAKLGCSPEYRDWAGDFGGQVIHVTGPSVIPSSMYTIWQIDASCGGQEETCLNASVPLIAETELWGNINGGMFNVLDVASATDRLKGAPGALAKPRAQINGNNPDPLSPTTVLDVSLVVDSLKGFAYPFSGPENCP